MLLKPSSLWSLYNTPINQESKCWGKEYDFIWKAGWPRRWQTNISILPSYWSLGANVCYRTEREKRWESKVKRYLSWKIGDMLISSSVQPFTGGLGQTVSNKGRGVGFLETDHYVWYSKKKKKKKQWKVKIKIKETDPTWNQNWLFPATVRLKNQKSSLIHDLQNECCVGRHENNINLIVHLHQSSWVTRYIVSEQ